MTTTTMMMIVINKDTTVSFICINQSFFLYIFFKSFFYYGSCRLILFYNISKLNEILLYTTLGYLEYYGYGTVTRKN